MIEFLTFIPTILSIIILVLIPIYSGKISNSTSVNNNILLCFFDILISLILSLIIAFFAAYWMNELSNNILLNYYGFNFEGGINGEFYDNVKPENIQKVSEIHNSMMGIGWPLKAILMYLFMILPYNIILTICLRLMWCKPKQNYNL